MESCSRRSVLINSLNPWFSCEFVRSELRTGRDRRAWGDVAGVFLRHRTVSCGVFAEEGLNFGAQCRINRLQQSVPFGRGKVLRCLVRSSIVCLSLEVKLNRLHSTRDSTPTRVVSKMWALPLSI